MTSSPDDPGVAGCINVLVMIILMAYFIPCFVFGWVIKQDEVASACPKLGVSTVVTHWTWAGPDFTVTCLNGHRVHIPTMAQWS